MKRREFITPAELIFALAACPAPYTFNFIDKEDLADTCIDGHYNIERATALINRLIAGRLRRSNIAALHEMNDRGQLTEDVLAALGVKKP